MKMRGIWLLGLLLAVLCFSGCAEQCRHQWIEASCEVPKLCTFCNATNGQPLGHIWGEADCTTAKTCSVCRKTEGDALGHAWRDATCTEPRVCTVCQAADDQPKGHDLQPANYQQAASCRDCEYTEGEPLPPIYADYLVDVIQAEIGAEYDYRAACYVPGYTTVGKLRWENYRIFASDETHEAVEGYEWHSVTVRIVFSDRDAQKYGFIVQSALDDYYWIASEEGNGYTDSFAVSFNGQLYDRCLMANGYGTVSQWEDGVCTYTAEFAWRVPVGYDAHLILFYNGEQNLQEALKNGDESLLAFRFTNA